MDDPEEPDEPSQGLPIDVAVLRARVRMLTRMMVTKHEFAPVKLIAYGIAAVALGSVLAEILSYVLRRAG